MRILLSGIIAFIILNVAFAQSTNEVSKAIQLPSHPRLLVKQSELADIKLRMSSPDFAAIREAFNQQRSFSTDGVSADGNPKEAIRQKMEAQALSYLIDPTQEKEAGKNAINLAKAYLPSINKLSGYEGNSWAYEAVFGAALVYDWCYPLLSNEDKTVLAMELKRVCCLGEYCPFTKVKKEYLTGHYCEMAPTVFLAMGLAIHDEDPTIFDTEYKEQVDSFAPSRNLLYKSGAFHQGSQYLHVRYGNEILQAFILDKVGLNPYSSENSAVTFRDIYAQIPQKTDMDGMPEGDCHNHIDMGDLYQQFIPLAASLSKDGFLQSYAKLKLNRLEVLSARAFIYYNPTIPSKPFDYLGLTRFFPSPSGIMIARTKWDLDRKDYNSNAMVVLMNMREYNARNHVHLDDGNFSIYYKGHLAIDAGIYQGKEEENGWGKEDYINYYIRTVAHNSLLILDPNEPTPLEGWNKKTKSRDGGQFSFSNKAWSTSQQMIAGGKNAQIMANEIAEGVMPDYSYLKGDMTPCYNVPKNVAIYPAKVDTVRRSFVFLNLKNETIPGALIVMDKVVSTNASFKKSWLLHAQNEPTIKNGKIIVENTNNGRNGKLQDDILLPELNNQNIESIGGEGKEYWVDGKNWGTVTQEDAGRWRIELSPKQASKSDNFLNVIQVMDAKPSPTAFSVNKSFAEKGNYVAVAISNRIVAQQLSLDKNDQEIAFTIGDTNKDYKVLIADLKAGEWKFKSSSTTKNIRVNDSAGTVYIESKGGHFSLTPIGFKTK